MPWRFLDAGQLSVRSFFLAGVQKPAQERTLRGKIERAGGKGLDTRPAKNLFMTKARSGIAHVSVA